MKNFIRSTAFIAVAFMFLTLGDYIRSSEAAAFATAYYSILLGLFTAYLFSIYEADSK